jgi:glycosyltransferase involved in cell wall biosynthesis
VTTTAPRISIVIPAHNEEKRIHLALRGIAADVRDQAGGDLEVIVVSDGSTDRTVETSWSFNRAAGKGARSRPE